MSDRVLAACNEYFDANRGDCSGFVRAVAGKLGVKLEGIADDIVETIRGMNGWAKLADGLEAARSARAGMLVIAGLKGQEQVHPSDHGHVVVVVAGPLNRDKYPSAFWGSLGGEPGDNQTINWAWTPEDRDRVSYAGHAIGDGVVEASGDLPWLGAAIRAAAPDADPFLWAGVLRRHLIASGLTTARRVAAFLGQAAAEAGPAFRELAEDTLYTHADRLCAVFPSRFPTLAIARQYVGDDQRIACRAYAGKLGNGDEVSGDGWHFRGSGLLQITGRDAYEAFSRLLQAPVDQVADWVRTPNGAAASACWYWREHRLNPLADSWNLPAITMAVNGTATLAYAQRVAASEAALRATNGP